MIGVVATLSALAGLIVATWWAVLALGLEYTSFRIGRGPVDVRAVYVAIGLFLLAELTMWSLDARSRVVEEADATRRRAAGLGIATAATLFLGSAIVAISRQGRSTGLTLTILGVGATIAIMLVIVWIAVRRHNAKSS